jgi:hypothetical protein
METPPPYRPAKKSNTGLIIGLIIGGVAICCIGPLLLLGGGAWFGFKSVGPMVTCAMAIEDVQKAMLKYADDHNGHLPKAETWQDDIKPYYVKESKKNDKEGNPFKVMPAEGNWGCDAGGTTTGFAFNSDLSDKEVATIKDKSTALVFEVPKTGHNLAMKYEKQDPNTSPKIFNERRGWFVAPVDGEVGLMSPKGKNVHFNTGQRN